MRDRVYAYAYCWFIGHQAGRIWIPAGVPVTYQNVKTALWNVFATNFRASYPEDDYRFDLGIVENLWLPSDLLPTVVPAGNVGRYRAFSPVYCGDEMVAAILRRMSTCKEINRG